MLVTNQFILMGSHQLIMRWIEESGVSADLTETVLLVGQDRDHWDFTPTDEEREAAKIHTNSEFGTLFFEREERERDERTARLAAINQEGLEAQIQYLLSVLGTQGTVGELMDSFSDLDDKQLTRLHEDFVEREEALWMAATKPRRKKKA